MTPLTITLPDTAQAYIDEHLASGTYTTADELLTALIIQEQKRQAKQKLNHMIRKGLNSGTPIEATDEWWEQKRVSIQ
jgi:antitoxin ParD1/3/4